MNSASADITVTEGRVHTGTPAFRRVNLALFCAGFITFVTLYDVQPLLPLFAREFGVPPAVASLPLSISTAALALGMLIAGTVSETLGRRLVMTVALFLTSLLALATCLSHSFQTFLVLRLLQGVVLAGVPSVAMAYLGEEMNARSLARLRHGALYQRQCRGRDDWPDRVGAVMRLYALAHGHPPVRRDSRLRLASQTESPECPPDGLLPFPRICRRRPGRSRLASSNRSPGGVHPVQLHCVC